MALLNKIKEDADKHNMSYGKYKEQLRKRDYYRGKEENFMNKIKKYLYLAIF